MSWEKAAANQVWNAIEIYLGQAYDAPVPAAVDARLAALRAAGQAGFYFCSCVEARPAQDPTRFDLRLGNRWYPHMKLVIEKSPDGQGHLFRADTHDRHIQPAPGSRDYEAFKNLMEKNCALAGSIEAAWEAAGLPTFKSFLRQDLARRQQATKT
jgi:hypothetical protein